MTKCQNIPRLKNNNAVDIESEKWWAAADLGRNLSTNKKTFPHGLGREGSFVTLSCGLSGTNVMEYFNY
jgi:hypothetical protein